eukprot:TRINITY_DN3704_c0_g1_i1.p1 TRINITY_DN3704_c0_g1~~TRINITY_DN3704_c0_g1_i1.p1  ORF type:complete len:582 (+),score=79.24 TRINITY_DN3704_c0_g1_i1:1-1746(+)
MILKILISILFFSTFTTQQSFNISTCAELTTMSMSNNAVVYYVSANIDCSGTLTFLPLGSSLTPFMGILDGQGLYKISNLKITGTSNAALFSFGQKAQIRNLNFENILVTGTGNNVAGLFGTCADCIITGVNFDISDLSLVNQITSTGSQYVGAFYGYSTNSIISMSTIKHTVISGILANYVGGFAGYMKGNSSNYISDCHNIGLILPTSSLASGVSIIGGLVGYLEKTSISNSGVRTGIISGTSMAGGIIGMSVDNQMDRLYVKSDISIILLGSNGGGICGSISFLTNGVYTLSNSYSKANLSGLNIGGLIGQVNTSSSTKLNFQNSYSSSILVGTSKGSSIGTIFGNNCTFQNVYYDSNKSQSSSNFTSEGSCSDSSVAVGYNCTSLYQIISSTYSSTVWGGDNLKIENPYTFGNCNCSGGCLVNNSTPSTISPSTEIPSTIDPSTKIPSTKIPSTIIPSTFIPPSSLIPTTEIPPNSVSSSEIQSSPIPTTDIPVTNTPSGIQAYTSLKSTSSSVSTSSDPSETKMETTFVPSTDSSLTLSTITPSTNYPSSSTPSNTGVTLCLLAPSRKCIYYVKNC